MKAALIYLSGLQLIVLMAVIGCFGAGDRGSPPDYDLLRERMVAGQIEARGIIDHRVLNAMRKVERHLFVPEEYRRQSYIDEPLPIGENQTISQPYIVAFMTELARVDSTDKVLEIGTGSGYQAAILGEIADSVFTIEIIEKLASRSGALLDSLRYGNIEVICGDGYRGWPEHAPFDAIIVTAAPPKVPEPLKDQLAEGGRMVIPVGVAFQELMLLEKVKGRIVESTVFPVRFVPMTGEAQDQ